MKDWWLVEDWLAKAAGGLVLQFRPTAVAKDIQRPLNEVFGELMGEVSRGHLELLWEIHCPECENIQLVGQSRLGGTVQCSRCGEELEVEPEVVLPLFQFSAGYKEHKKKEQASNPQLPAPVYQRLHVRPLSR